MLRLGSVRDALSHKVVGCAERPTATTELGRPRTQGRHLAPETRDSELVHHREKRFMPIGFTRLLFDAGVMDCVATQPKVPNACA
jgi:hypothetical protein